MYQLLIGLVVRYLSLLDGSNEGQYIYTSSMWASVHQSLVNQILKHLHIGIVDSLRL